MGRLLDGQWVSGDLGTDAKGRYIRRQTQFRERLIEAEAGRYRLYVSHACPWCHRVMIARALLGLEEVVPVTVVEPFMGEQGWTLPEGADPIGGPRQVHEIYTATQADYTGRASVPVLVDKQTSQVVNNESSDLVRMFDDAFARLVGAEPGQLWPADLEDAIQAQIDANYNTVNNGVYRAGFAGSQEAHAEAVTELFARLDALEEHLATRRYLCGDRFTMADVCLFPTLYRFDSVYTVHFKCNVRRLVDYPSLWAYTRDVYQRPGVAGTCEMGDIKEHYYTSHESINPRRLVPLGPDLDFDAPHGRDALK